MPPPHQRPLWPAALATALVAALVLGAVAFAAMIFALRDDASRTADALRAESQRIARAVDGQPAPVVRRELDDAGVAARVVGARGGIVAEGPLAALWSAGAAPPPARAAVLGTGASVRDGLVEASVPLEGGRRLVARAPLAMGAGGVVRGAAPAGALVGLLALGAGALAWRRAAGRRRHAGDRADALRAIAAGRTAARPPAARGADLAGLDAAIGDIAGRVASLQDAAETRMEALGATLAPLPLPAAARTPRGGLVRNEALERLVREVPGSDADRLEEALRAGLAASGAVSRRVVLEDGRAIDCDSWAVPGGRVVTLAERTEQARMRELRADISRAAARVMRGPLEEIRAEARRLSEDLGGAGADGARTILAGADRLERVAGRIMRADGAEVAGRAARVRPVGVSALAFGLGRAYDRRLRELGLRLEHDVPADLPDAMADPGLLHEVLAELIDNAAAATPRGGVLTLRGRPAGDRRVEIAVLDTGTGVPAHERALVFEPFGRGAAAATRPGVGLGLGVARALVERMGGTLALEPGPGGLATVEMPANVRDGRRASPDASAQPAPAGADAAAAPPEEPADPALTPVPAAAP